MMDAMARRLQPPRTPPADALGAPADAPPAPAAPPRSNPWLRAAVALACALLGFLLVAQVRATENLGDRLGAEREEDLARILAELTAQSDELQAEITELRLTLLGFETSAESDELALASLQRRLDDLRILAGAVAVEGEGLQLTVEDPGGAVGQARIVDVIQELRDAGAEAIAINDLRLVASSAITTRNDRLLVDGIPIEQPIRVAAIGPGQTMATALEIRGGAVDTLTARAGVTVTVDVLDQLTLAARAEPVPFVFGEPVQAAVGE